MVSEAYGPLALITESTTIVKTGAVVPVKLLCGCSSGLWNYLVTWVAYEGDSVEALASRFGVSMGSIEAANGFSGVTDLVPGDIYYIPLDSVPGDPYSLKAAITPASAPTPDPPYYPLLVTVNRDHHTANYSFGWIIGSIGATLILVAIILLICILFKSIFCCSQTSKNRSVDSFTHSSHNFHVFQRGGLCSSSGLSCLCFKFGNKKPVSGDTSDHQLDIPTGTVADAFDLEKPVVFSYEEIVSSTDGFSDANLLGHGSYGSVYYGVLRDQEVSIKRMTATKNKEFLAEMKVLGKVHHASLVELIGYAASGDELFVIYEYAQKGSLKSHLHDPQSRGHTSPSWITRVQIAIDAAKGLEYIHEHTRNHYVHRDIKTSNILLDSCFRAKISDFGLAKLISKSNDEVTATKVVGTFGYLAPEYLHDGLATAKSDVYAFGVVLFELISGKKAVTHSEGTTLTNVERRSLASIMLGALKNSPNSMNMASLKEYIDPNMMNLYPTDCVYKMAILAKQCVDEDPILRPDMSQVVISLSHILLSSVEWESTLAGNSQVFSGLVQGR